MNATQLLADIKRKAQIEADNASLTDLDILDIATKELQTVIVPKILGVRERYFARYKDFTLSTTRNYRIPPNAIGNKLLQVEYIETVGSNQSQRDLNFVSPINNPRLEGYHIRNSDLVLTAYAPSTGTLRMHYAVRSGALSETVVTVSSVNTASTNQISMSSGAASIGDKVTIQKASSPFEYVIFLEPVTSIDGGTGLGVSTGAVDIASVEVGDVIYVHSAATLPVVTTTYYPQIPTELHDWLSLRTVIRILESLGHGELLNMHKTKLVDMEKDILAIITPRVDGSPKVVSCGELLGWSD